MKVISRKDFDISEIVAALTAGQTIVYPTETCYGLGCDATNEDAVRKIFQIKGRMENKPLLVLASDLKMVKKYAVESDLLEKLAKKYWPGPLTIILPIKSKVILPPGVASADKTVAVRVSDFDFINKIIKKFGKPIVSTSANLAGAENTYSGKDAMKIFSGRVVEPDIVIDGGILPVCKPSTIVSVVNGKVEVVRQGELKVL